MMCTAANWPAPVGPRTLHRVMVGHTARQDGDANLGTAGSVSLRSGPTALKPKEAPWKRNDLSTGELLGEMVIYEEDLNGAELEPLHRLDNHCLVGT